MALDNVTFASMVSELASQEYKDRVPVATQDNIGSIEEIITTYPSAKNEFISVLTNQVAKQLFFSKAYENPYKLFNRGMLPFGKSIESIFVDIIKGKQNGLYVPNSISIDGSKNLKLSFSYQETADQQTKDLVVENYNVDLDNTSIYQDTFSTTAHQA